MRPFSNGTEYGMWMERNCWRCCAKAAKNPDAMPRCSIEKAISLAAIMDGEVSDKIAARMGGMRKDGFMGDCTEFEEPRVRTRRKRQGRKADGMTGDMFAAEVAS